MNAPRKKTDSPAFSILFARARVLGVAVLLGASLAACGGGGGGGDGGAFSPSTPALSTTSSGGSLGDPNVAPVYVDGGPNTSTVRVLNAIYADVKVCAPGSTTNCAVIDHVLVDTGSVGLRLLSSALPPALLAAMPQATANNGILAGECLAFISGVTWGGVRSADLLLGGSSFNGSIAANIRMQIIGDPESRVSSVPSSCSSQGQMTQTVSTLNANGIIGVGLFAQDCGYACSSAAASVYYSCPSAGACSPTPMALSRQVPNPISSFGADSNGNTLVMPYPAGGASPRLDGLLVFGIGTRSNNGVAANSSILGTNTGGYFQSVFNGNSLPNSFIDSGSSINFFPPSGTSNVAPCDSPYQVFFCPSSPLTLAASNFGRASTSSSTSIYVVNALSAFNSKANAMSGLAGSNAYSFNSLDLGSNFFYGRSISTLIEGQSAAGFSVIGPAFSHTP